MELHLDHTAIAARMGIRDPIIQHIALSDAPVFLSADDVGRLQLRRLDPLRSGFARPSGPEVKAQGAVST
ncbi:hypothetical protein HYR69_06265 [Candidatus Sumerlaeota bacterium]|nr:hypothetical protein [Candidatus Sumerlaeota bacterium]